MCGIVGILGRELVAASLIDALKRLEYRGLQLGPTARRCAALSRPPVHRSG